MPKPGPAATRPPAQRSAVRAPGCARTSSRPRRALVDESPESASASTLRGRGPPGPASPPRRSTPTSPTSDAARGRRPGDAASPSLDAAVDRPRWRAAADAGRGRWSPAAAPTSQFALAAPGPLPVHGRGQAASRPTRSAPSTRIRTALQANASTSGGLGERRTPTPTPSWSGWACTAWPPSKPRRATCAGSAHSTGSPSPRRWPAGSPGFRCTMTGRTSTCRAEDRFTSSLLELADQAGRPVPDPRRRGCDDGDRGRY